MPSLLPAAIFLLLAHVAVALRSGGLSSSEPPSVHALAADTINNDNAADGCSRVARALFAGFSEWKLSQFPEFSGAAGFYQFDALLYNISMPYLHEVEQKAKAYLVQAVDLMNKPGGDCTRLERHHLDMLKMEAETLLQGLQHRAFVFAPVNFREGLQFALPIMFSKKSKFRLESLEDYRNVLHRLKRIPLAINETMEALSLGVRQNRTYARESLIRTKEQFAMLQVSQPEDSHFYTLFRDLSEDFGDTASVRRLQREARDAIQYGVLPAFRVLDDYIHEEYMEYTRPAPGVWSMPGGDEFYRACLRFHTSLADITPQEVHSIGLEAVAEKRRKMVAVAPLLGMPNATFEEIIERLQHDEGQEFDSPEDALAFYRDVIRRVISPRLAGVVRLDSSYRDRVLQLEVAPTPPGDGGVVYYKGPSRDSRRRGTFYVNLHKTGILKRFETSTLALHEGNPGHHYQTVFMRLHDLPAFLQYACWDKLSSVPSRLPLNEAHSEGWGLYSEYLGLELGVYDDDPYQLVGFHSWGLLRAARLVVDTGLHMFGWSRDRAMEYLLANTAISRRAAEMEVDRYITWPGQATSYKMGERAIRMVRRAREKALGESFDLREFHRNVILCVGPLDKLEDCVQMHEEDSARRRLGPADAARKSAGGGTGRTTTTDSAVLAVAVALVFQVVLLR